MARGLGGSHGLVGPVRCLMAAAAILLLADFLAPEVEAVGEVSLGRLFEEMEEGDAWEYLDRDDTTSRKLLFYHRGRPRQGVQYRKDQIKDLESWLERCSSPEPEVPAKKGSHALVAGDFIPNVTEAVQAYDLQGHKSGSALNVKYYITVDCKGTGDYKTIKGAISYLLSVRNDRIPKKRTTVFIKNCVYREKVYINSSLEYLTLEGESAKGVIIEWGDTAGTKLPGQKKGMGTFKTATVAVNSDYFIAKNITFVNTAPSPAYGSFLGMAVAYRITADFGAHYGCRFIGWQDTLYDHVGKHYFSNCYIQGSVDFVFGNGSTIYEGCTLYAAGPGYLTAQKRFRPRDDTGFVFLRSKVLGKSMTMLGRAWGNYSRVVYAYCYLANIIGPGGWDDFTFPARQKTTFYAEYKNWGPGAVDRPRNRWTYILTDQQAKPFLTYAFINQTGWLPAQKPQGTFAANEFLPLASPPPGSKSKEKAPPTLNGAPPPSSPPEANPSGDNIEPRDINLPTFYAPPPTDATVGTVSLLGAMTP